MTTRRSEPGGGIDSMRPATGFRFQPPRLAVPGAARRALLFAFAPRSVGQELDLAAWQMAGRLGVQEPIALHHHRGEIGPPLDPALERRLQRLLRSTLALDLLYDDLARQLVEVARGLRIPLVFLKGYALRALDLRPPGARSCQDLDVLASEEGGRRITAALEEAGFTVSAAPRNEQHLPALRSPLGGLVDIHFRLRGVNLGGRAWARAEELAEAEAVAELPSLPGAFAPRRWLLAAHLLAHGVEQHGFRPQGYPLLRMVADLGALLPDDAAWERFEARHLPAIAATVAPREVKAVRDLHGSLAGGSLPDPRTRPEAERLLRHLVAAAERPSYRRALRWRHRLHRIRSAWRLGELRSYLGRKTRFRLPA